MPLPGERNYAIDDIYNLPDGERAELIDGQIFHMAPPTIYHFTDSIKVNIYEDFSIDFSQLKL